jgi:hypothetical protein
MLNNTLEENINIEPKEAYIKYLDYKILWDYIGKGKWFITAINYKKWDELQFTVQCKKSHLEMINLAKEHVKECVERGY